MLDGSDPPLSREKLTALRQSCNPTGVLSFLPADKILSLQKLEYVEVVLGGVQITPLGLKRLIRENAQRAKP